MNNQKAHRGEKRRGHASLSREQWDEKQIQTPFAYNEGAPSEENSNLIQIIVVISSGILSSSAIATVVKAWLDNRKTTLTIQIDGGRKKLEYEGHHFNQDAAVIQTILDTLSEDTKVAKSVDTVTIDLTDDGQKEEYVLESGRENTTCYLNLLLAMPMELVLNMQIQR